MTDRRHPRGRRSVRHAVGLASFAVAGGLMAGPASAAPEAPTHEWPPSQVTATVQHAVDLMSDGVNDRVLDRSEGVLQNDPLVRADDDGVQALP